MTEKIENNEAKAPTTKELMALCVRVADDRKAENIVSLNVAEFSSLADFYVLCTGGSEPHLKAIIDNIGREIKKEYLLAPRRVDGTAASHWMLMDYGNVIVHVMTEEARELYNLENLWGDAVQIDIKEIVKLDSLGKSK
ncbi:ribosome silencing factor [Lentisphaerota bacterium WC36G]|nr:ribosome silencing factor [Lentisphaerae bacterium WC36]